MKRILISTVLIVAFILPSVAQEKEQKLKELEMLEEQTEEVTPPDTLTTVEMEVDTIIEDVWDDTSRIKIGDIVTVEDTDDETVIRIGKKAVKILEQGDNTEVRIFEDEFEESDDPAERRKSFDGHLGGIEIGYNNFTSGKWLSNETPVEGWLDLNTAKSTSFNIIFPPVSLGFTRHFGLVTALGVNFNNYRFDGNNSIVVNGEGIVTPSYPADPIRFD
jgi:hypothetical protein